MIQSLKFFIQRMTDFELQIFAQSLYNLIVKKQRGDRYDSMIQSSRSPEAPDNNKIIDIQTSYGNQTARVHTFNTQAS